MVGGKEGGKENEGKEKLVSGENSEEKTQKLNELENVIALNDDGQLDVRHLRKVAAAIVEAHDEIDWEKLKCTG